MTEIRSYRRVFDLERRIYSVDRIRLNPGGVPVRGVVYLLAVIALLTTAARLPVAGEALALLPWYLRELAVPVAVAAFLAVVHVDGRTFHLTAWSLARMLSRPKRVTALQRASRCGGSWRPPAILLLPDGSDASLRALRYRGPGAVRVNVAHTRRPGRRRAQRRAVVEIHGAGGPEPGGRGHVITLRRGSELVVVPRDRA